MTSTLKAYALRLFPQVAALAVILLMVSIAFPGFFRLEMQNGRLYGSLIDILNRGAPVALLAIGMTVVIATKGIDLSVGAVMAICGAVAAACITSGYGLVATLLVTLGTGILCGLWNGILVAVLDIQPIIATLVLMVAGRGIAQLVTEGAILTFNDPGLIFIGGGSFLGLPMPVVIWIAFGIVVALLVRRTALGMLIEALGVNRRASMLSGVSTGVLLIAAYVLSGLCTAIAGIIAAADIRGADANNAGQLLELDAILAVALGGTALAGGRFSLAGSLVGALIIQALTTTIYAIGVPPQVNLVVKALLVTSVLLLQSPEFRGQLRARLPRSAGGGA